MVVMFGADKNGIGTLVLGVTDDQMLTIRCRGLTLTYAGAQPVGEVTNVIVLHGQDPADIIDQIEACGIPVSEEFRNAILEGERTDRGKARGH